ncbi:hypothetical protein HF086_005437 [Spodoptera exigua]|uniref:Uncharacterized protein n=1 Tax=Spodoptera exigua TaxID=7107 RepID=A0A922MBZ9_SPOEX|nr:hypothetical protein HF086_005437 [Spodoptera exigua]
MPRKVTQSTQTKRSLSKELDLEALLLELGEFGLYQRWVFVYLGLAIIFTSIYNCQYVFTAAGDNYRCKVPACEQSPPVYDSLPWGKFALPSTGYDCYQKIPIGKSCAPESFSNKTRRCYSWVYEEGLSLVAEFDLACQEWKRTLVGTIHNFGVFLAIPLTAAVSDTYGRRFALIGTCVAPAFFGLMRAFCNNYILYLFLEFVEALVGNGTYSTAFILAKCNKVQLLPETKAILTGAPKKIIRSTTIVTRSLSQRPQRKEKNLITQVLQSRTMVFRISVVSFWWVSVTMIYYGLSINSVSLMGNKNLNGNPDFGGQDDEQLDLLWYLHLHSRVVPDERAPPAAGILLHDGPNWLHVRATDASVGWSVYILLHTLNIHNLSADRRVSPSCDPSPTATMAGTVDLDAILLELGQFGRYQIRNYCFILLVILMSAVYNSQYIFAAGEVSYR